VRDNVRKKARDRDEEIITDMFHSELEDGLATVSKKGAVEQAFLEDLKQAFPNIEREELRSKIARRVIATVSFHSHQVEMKTGGDLGIVFVRPDVHEAAYGSSAFRINRDYKRGLLCQAKIFRRDSQWGGLSPSQVQKLQGKMKYFALLLYRYADQDGERRDLMPFSWQLGVDATVEEVCQWLKADKFLKLQDSQQILRGLIRDDIGTNNKELIERDIAPPLRPSLVIKVGWKDGDPPGGTVHLQEHSTAVNSQRIMQSH